MLNVLFETQYTEFSIGMGLKLFSMSSNMLELCA